MSIQTFLQQYFDWLTNPDPDGSPHDVTGFLVVHQGELNFSSTTKLQDSGNDPRARNTVHYGGGHCVLAKDGDAIVLQSKYNWRYAQNVGFYEMAPVSLRCAVKITKDGMLTVRTAIPELGGSGGVVQTLQATVVSGTTGVLVATDLKAAYTLSLNRNRLEKPIG